MQDFVRVTDNKTAAPRLSPGLGAWDLGSYQACNHISHNVWLTRQFNDFLVHFLTRSITTSALENYFNNHIETQAFGLLWCESESIWPASYSLHSGQILINSVLTGIHKSKIMARFCALTEIFDQVIYAQLHRQTWMPQLEVPLAGPQKSTLPQLLRIKMAKQHAAEHNHFFQEAEPQFVVDPYCAWSLAFPRYIQSPDTARAELKLVALENQIHSVGPHI